jgi:hypothetical protein
MRTHRGLQLANEWEVYTKPDGELRVALNQYQHEILIPKPDGSSNIPANGRSLKAKKNLAINALMQAVTPLGMASLTPEQLQVACPARSLEALQKYPHEHQHPHVEDGGEITLLRR